MPDQWKWYVYVVECLDGFYYTGRSWNIDQRVNQHQTGKGSKFTVSMGLKSLSMLRNLLK